VGAADQRPQAHLHRRRRDRGGSRAGRVAGQWEQRYPAIIRLWRAHWAEFTPFLAFPPEVRRVIYTTNLIESMNARLRKVTRNGGQFPSEQAALKVLYLAVRNLEEFRTANTGIRSSGWETGSAGVHHLLRRANPDPMKPATITYTDGRTLPSWPFQGH
jgi:transposase-like protein